MLMLSDLTGLKGGKGVSKVGFHFFLSIYLLTKNNRI